MSDTRTPEQRDSDRLKATAKSFLRIFHSKNAAGPANLKSRCGVSAFYLSHGRRGLLMWVGRHTVFITHRSRHATRATRIIHVGAR